MNVICIDAKKRNEETGLIEGKVYESSNPIQCKNGCCLHIKELGFDLNKDRFIPLSSIDETEMIREYKTEPVCH